MHQFPVVATRRVAQFLELLNDLGVHAHDLHAIFHVTPLTEQGAVRADDTNRVFTVFNILRALLEDMLEPKRFVFDQIIE